jgi:phosphoenolpyruvate carboxykinase (ATP)
LIRPSAEELASYEPDWTIIDLGKVSTDPVADGVRSDATIALSFTDQMVLIFGTQYAGEMKKSVFTIMNYLLPKKGVLSMHCSANVNEAGQVALFFGLSGTGKTTLSADHDRMLIGDDEHGWSDDGVFNVEGGCYAKCIDLKPESEPEIFNAIKFGSVLENVILGDGRVPNYADTSLTQNTRCAYPIHHIPGAVEPSVGGHPSHIVFLTCDANGVLPPISRLTPEQAMFHFLNGYTAKVAGTELGVKDPELTFSTCFGAPFLPLRPMEYAQLLKEKIARHEVTIWLLNTGWTGGGFGVGHRMKLSHTRQLIRSAFAGDLDSVEYNTDPIFGLSVPQSCPDVPTEVLNPRDTWADKAAYDAAATKLSEEFNKNFEKYR